MHRYDRRRVSPFKDLKSIEKSLWFRSRRNSDTTIPGMLFSRDPCGFDTYPLLFQDLRVSRTHCPMTSANSSNRGQTYQRTLNSQMLLTKEEHRRRSRGTMKENSQGQDTNIPQSQNKRDWSITGRSTAKERVSVHPRILQQGAYHVGWRRSSFKHLNTELTPNARVEIHQ
jgi:hypothetical protein